MFVDNMVTHSLSSYLNYNQLPTSLVIIQCPFEKKMLLFPQILVAVH